MADVVAQYVAASDNANEYSTNQVDDIKQKALEDIDDLMANDTNRDEELWDELEADVAETVSDFEAVEQEDREVAWLIGFSAVSAASAVQFFLSNRQALIIDPAAYRRQKMAGFNLTRAQMIQAGKRQVDAVDDFTYQKLQSKYVREFSALDRLSNTELYNLLRDNKGLKSMDKLVADQAGYVSRMTSYPSGSAQFKEAVADLVNHNSGRALKGMNRRSVESLSIIAESGGNIETLLVWLLDPNSKHCSECPARAGEVKTLAEWEADGMPGEEVCLGGSLCHCHLAAV